MASKEQLEVLQRGVLAWNEWRKENPDVNIDLSGADLYRAKLHAADLRGADLSGANLREASLVVANLHQADLREARFPGASLSGADLRGADLSSVIENTPPGATFGDKIEAANLSTAHLGQANLSRANLSEVNLVYASLNGARLVQANLSGARLNGADLSEADLRGADLNTATLVNTKLYKANITGCRIYGVSAWNLNVEETVQNNLIITDDFEPEITVDNLEVAQFVYLLLHNEKIRDVIDTITTKAVLILGRFTEERKAVLDAIREELRMRGYVPILFDFEKPGSRDLTETIVTLAHLSRFIIADITDAKSIPQELQAVVSNLPSVAVKPIIHISQREYAMFEHFQRYPWVLSLYEYDTQEQLILELSDKIIQPVEDKVNELRPLLLK